MIMAGTAFAYPDPPDDPMRPPCGTTIPVWHDGRTLDAVIMHYRWAVCEVVVHVTALDQDRVLDFSELEDCLAFAREHPA